jgi:hypothetical protein
LQSAFHLLIIVHHRPDKRELPAFGQARTRMDLLDSIAVDLSVGFRGLRFDRAVPQAGCFEVIALSGPRTYGA